MAINKYAPKSRADVQSAALCILFDMLGDTTKCGYFRVLRHNGHGTPKKKCTAHEHQHYASTFVGHGRQIKVVPLIPSDHIPFLGFVKHYRERKQPESLQKVQTSKHCEDFAHLHCSFDDAWVFYFAVGPSAGDKAASQRLTFSVSVHLVLAADPSPLLRAPVGRRNLLDLPEQSHNVLPRPLD